MLVGHVQVHPWYTFMVIITKIFYKQTIKTNLHFSTTGWGGRQPCVEWGVGGKTGDLHTHPAAHPVHPFQHSLLALLPIKTHLPSHVRAASPSLACNAINMSHQIELYLPSWVYLTQLEGLFSYSLDLNDINKGLLPSTSSTNQWLLFYTCSLWILCSQCRLEDSSASQLFMYIHKYLLSLLLSSCYAVPQKSVTASAL